jgi:uncharacterized oligopeptide transporter (OPT) family protein
MTATQIFRGYVRFMGVGAIATAGIIGILKALPLVIGSFSVAARTFQAAGTTRWSAPTALSRYEYPLLVLS